MGEEKKSVETGSQQKAGARNGGNAMDIKASLVDALTELQRLAPAGGEVYRDYENLKGIVNRQEDRNVLIMMARDLDVVLKKEVKNLEGNATDESGVSV